MFFIYHIDKPNLFSFDLILNANYWLLCSPDYYDILTLEEIKILHSLIAKYKIDTLIFKIEPDFGNYLDFNSDEFRGKLRFIR